MTNAKDKGPGTEAMRRLDTVELEAAVTEYEGIVADMGPCPARQILEVLIQEGKAELSERRSR